MTVLVPYFLCESLSHFSSLGKSSISSQLPPVGVAVAVHMPSSSASWGGTLEHVFMHGKN